MVRNGRLQPQVGMPSACGTILRGRIVVGGACLRQLGQPPPLSTMTMECGINFPKIRTRKVLMLRPLVLIDAAPRSKDMIFSGDAEARLNALADVVEHYDGRMPDAVVDANLSRADIIIGQTPMDAKRLARAERLKAIINVKGNWEPVIDYAEAHRRGIQVLSIAPAMAPAVAEMCVGFAIALGRGIVRNDRRFRAGSESYG